MTVTERFIAQYEGSSELALVPIGSDATPEVLPNRKCLYLIQEHFDFLDDLYFSNRRFKELFPSEKPCFALDMLPLSAVLFLKIREASQRWQDRIGNSTPGILLVTVNNTIEGGRFLPLRGFFKSLSTCFQEVWVWTADEDRQYHLDRRLQRLIPIPENAYFFPNDELIERLLKNF